MMVTSGVLSYSDSRMLTRCAFYCMRYFGRQKHAYNPSHFPKREKETSEMDATNKTVTVKRVNVRYLTVTAMLSAVAYILMFLDFSVPFMPSFIKMDLSELPALIGSFAMGPLCGVIICLVKMYFICSLHPQEELESFQTLFWVWHLYCRQGSFISTKDKNDRTDRFHCRSSDHGCFQHCFKLLSGISGLLQFHATGGSAWSISADCSVHEEYFTVFNLL